MASFNWTCPHCNRAQSVTDNRHSISTTFIGVTDVAEGSVAIRRFSIGCANPDCNKLTLEITVGRDAGGNQWTVDPANILFHERVIPRGASKPQPDFIPKAIVEDYHEACLIKDLSPKAAATLARRCLQGMIRDFCGIRRNRLIDEVNDLRSAVQDGKADRSVTEESVQAIDHVRTIGNIGAHMEKDIDLIVQVDAGEAQALIDLIEILFDEWYVARNHRQSRLRQLEAIAVSKAEARKG